MVFVQSLIIVLLASQAAIVAAAAGERTTEPAAVRVQKNSGHHATEDAGMTAARPLDRVAIAVEGVEFSHGKDIGMWRPNPSGPQGPMQVSEAAAMDVGGGDRLELTQIARSDEPTWHNCTDDTGTGRMPLPPTIGASAKWMRGSKPDDRPIGFWSA